MPHDPDGVTSAPVVVRSAGPPRRSELKLKVRARHDEVALVVKVDGLRLDAEACVTCPLGLVSILGGAAQRKVFTCERESGCCAGRGIAHAFNVERRGDALIWTRTNYPAGSSSVTFDHHQACVEVCRALLELKSAVDAAPGGIGSCVGVMPAKFSYAELLDCIEQSRRMAAASAKP
jgi:hypothetical protein